MAKSSIFGKIDQIMEGGERAHFILQGIPALVGILMGKEPSENAPQAIKAMSGAFGKGDEILMQHLLQDLRQSYIDEASTHAAGVRAGNEAVEIMTDFIEWHFRDAQFRTPTGRIITWWYLNSWRVFITKMTAQPTKIGTKKTVSKGKADAKPDDTDVMPWVLYGPNGEILSRGPKPRITSGYEAETTSETDLFSSKNDQGVQFLRHIVAMIKSYNTREEGYEAALRFFKAWGIPVMPKNDMVGWFIEWSANYLKETAPVVFAEMQHQYRRAADATHTTLVNETARLRTKREERGNFSKFVRWFLPFT